MVDIHSHILPGLDDGARTLEESVEMVKMAADAGTTDIVATPHSNLEYTFDPDLVDRKIAEVLEASGPLLRIHRGCDFHLHFDNIQDALANPAKYAINGKRYLLVEFSDLLVARTSREVLSRLQDAGVAPIITHPERNFLLQQRIAEVREWVLDGCCVQITAASLSGRFGRRARECSDELLSRGMVHFVASDAHDCRDRTPRLDTAFRHVERNYGSDCAERLFLRNPRSVLTGEPLDGEQIMEPPTRRKWYTMWKS